MKLQKSLFTSLSIFAIFGVLSACSTLPRDGPSASAVNRGAVSGAPGYLIVDLDYATSERVRTSPAAFDLAFLSEPAGSSATTIGPGDVLLVSIFEPGGALFGSGGASMRAANQDLPSLSVDTSGSVQVPYAGSVQVAGLSSAAAANAIRRALIGKVINPQVVVSVTENVFNTVTVLGDVRQPGRAPLSSNTGSLIDVIANRGGASRATEDIQVVIQRDGRTLTAPLSAVYSDFGNNIQLRRGDQVNLVNRPRRFSTFGAMGGVALIEMPPGMFTLTDAISRVGGLDTNSADARSVMVFRFERPEVVTALGLSGASGPRGVPVIYRLDLAEAEGFFVANNFTILPDDVLYVPRSGSAELGKFFTLVRTLSGVIYDVTITNTLRNQ